MNTLMPLKYYIADYADHKSRILIRRELPQNEYVALMKTLLVPTIFRDCYSVKEMLLESKNDILYYFNTLSTKVVPPDDSIVSPCLITANKLLMNYLSFLKTFLDVVSNSISKIHSEELPVFQKYDSKLYDDLLGYRFLKRLRNYAIHREMPLKHIEVSSKNGIQITCKRSTLLEFEGWSTVRNEILELTDTIDIMPYIEDSKIAVFKLYVRALKIIERDMCSLKLHFERLYSGGKAEFPIIIKIGKTIHEVAVETLPVYYLDLFFSELNRYSIYGENDSQ